MRAKQGPAQVRFNHGSERRLLVTVVIQSVIVEVAGEPQTRDEEISFGSLTPQRWRQHLTGKRRWLARLRSQTSHHKQTERMSNALTD